ncbi:MAG: universal stress protein, partial [Marinicella sp.]
VWLIKSTEQKGYKKIVVALDYEPNNPESDKLNNQMLSMAISLAFSEFSELHVVHAWDFAHESLLRSTRIQNTDAEVDAMLKTEEDQRKKWLTTIVESSLSTHSQSANDYLNPILHVIKGEAKYVIPNLTKELGAELIIMGTVGRSGIPGYIIGNTAETILTAIDCSVLAVKPNGFVSPIRIDYN